MNLKSIALAAAVTAAGLSTALVSPAAFAQAKEQFFPVLEANGTLFKNEGITHRVPFCPRSGTPLVQKAQASWFIDIASQKDKLIAANEKINWFPEYLKHGRFAKGIE